MRLVSSFFFARLAAYRAATPVDLTPFQQSNHPQSRQQVDCNTPANGLDGSYWKTLGISAYLQNWTTYYMPKFTGALHSDFASCLQSYINEFVPNQNCSINDPSGCAIPPDLNGKGETISPTDYYVLWNIFACNFGFHKRNYQADEVIENLPILQHHLVRYLRHRPHSSRLCQHFSTKNSTRLPQRT